MSVLDNVTLGAVRAQRVDAEAEADERGRDLLERFGSPGARTTGPTSCPAASSSGWRWSGRSQAGPGPCCLTR